MAHEEQTPQDNQQTESVNDEQLDAATETAEKIVDENGESEEQNAETLAQELAAAVAEVESLKDQMLRIQAEAQNVRRRAEQDVEKAHKFGVEKFANEMLPIVDSLERAIEAFGDDEALQPVREGVEMTMKMFLSGLEKFKMEQVSPLGEAFDPALHQAMSMVDAPDAEPNSVIAVMQKGYTLHGRLVRPAMVVVAKG
ncbi:nucleotide exchange factor GrpE [Neptuniibacter marinus]|uniref:nucleotide exchange factor GrpE n=1 Tax=Neptuniibacter marinus TaxID=1806670 RepID=UPI00082CF57C|nr:nucleotide exchange factor GrpE [Neptuniibacter marinus]